MAGANYAGQKMLNYHLNMSPPKAHLILKQFNL